VGNGVRGKNIETLSKDTFEFGGMGLSLDEVNDVCVCGGHQVGCRYGALDRQRKENEAFGRDILVFYILTNVRNAP
jgi:hypothetical protein